MREELLGVIGLQREYSSENTPAMQRRGVLIRQTIPLELSRISADLSAALGPHGMDLDFQGRDGTGRKTIIPWVRFFSTARSPSAQNGWYCVYLFDAKGSGVYLELGHGSTTLENGEYRPRAPEELAKLVSWGRNILGPVLIEHPELSRSMELGGQQLGGAYEQSCVLTKWYPASAMPEDDELFRDAVKFAGYLKRIYDAELLGLAPTAPIPEILEVETAASGQAERRGSKQGFGLKPLERRAVELHAMDLAKERLENDGWRVRDVSLTRPYDFDCTRGPERLIVEVKGTTSHGDQIILTKGEVAAQRAHYPNNTLIIVHSINLSRTTDPPTAQGGKLVQWHPWSIEEESLTPMVFQHEPPPRDGAHTPVVHIRDKAGGVIQ